jgi:hypothetical protein
VVVTLSSLRYDDGKMLKGIGTRASKSRLTTFSARSLLECLSTCRKEDKKGSLASEVKKGKERERKTLLYSTFRMRLGDGMGELDGKWMIGEWGCIMEEGGFYGCDRGWERKKRVVEALWRDDLLLTPAVFVYSG